MGKQIIEQPNGQYAIFSSDSDEFVLLNASREEVAEFLVSRAVRDAKERAERDVEEMFSLLSGQSLSWKEACEVREREHKDDHSQERVKLDELVAKISSTGKVKHDRKV